MRDAWKGGRIRTTWRLKDGAEVEEGVEGSAGRMEGGRDLWSGARNTAHSRNLGGVERECVVQRG
jgi:hypothetical protein